MQEHKYFQKNNILGDYSEREAFLEKAEELLRNSQPSSALDLAERRIEAIPGDVDAGVVMAQALIGLKRQSEAFLIIEKLKNDLHRWTYRLEILEDLAQESIQINQPGENTAIPEIKGQNDSLQEPEFTESLSVNCQGSHEPDHKDSIILEEFYTPTMAELFILQGHLDMAKEIYQGLLIKNPEDSSSRERLKDIEEMLSGKKVIKGEGQKSKVINELERWMQRIEKSR